LNQYPTDFFIEALLGGIFLNGQSVSFEYDDAGNRIARTTLILNSQSNNESLGNSNYQNETNARSQDGQLLNFQRLAETQVNVYPNPTTGILIITFKDIEKLEDLSMQLFNTSGILMESRKLVSDSEVFDMKHYTEGIYILRINCLNKKVEYKIIKQYYQIQQQPFLIKE
jgi:hypothetical protein